MNELRFTTREAKTGRTGELLVGKQTIKTPFIVHTGNEITKLSPKALTQVGVRAIKVNGLEWWLKYPKLSRVGDLHELFEWPGLLMVSPQTAVAYELAKPRGKKDDGVRFHDPATGQLKFYQPADALSLQRILGADILQSFSRAEDYYAPVDDLVASVEQTVSWLAENESIKSRTLGVVTGGGLRKLRTAGIRAVNEVGTLGYSIAGIPANLGLQEFNRITSEITAMLENNKLRYLPTSVSLSQLIMAVKAGFDMVDNDLASKKAAIGVALVSPQLTAIHLDRDHFSLDDKVLDKDCQCPVCQQGYSRKLLHNLVIKHSIRGEQLLLCHNLYVLNHLMDSFHQAIAQDQLADFIQDLMDNH